MSVLFTPRALAEAQAIDAWWRQNRPAAPELLQGELERAVMQLGHAPRSGMRYGRFDASIPMRRVLLPRTRNHVYYVIRGEDVVILSVWAAVRGRGPVL